MSSQQSSNEQINNPQWQTVKKRKRLNLTPESSMEKTPFNFNSQNRYEELSNTTDNEDMQTEERTVTNNETNNQPIEHKPPPIYIYGVNNYDDMINYLTKIIEKKEYYCKALPNETIKINTKSSQSYRKLIKQLQNDKIIHHTYQTKEERTYRVVIRNLHHTTNTDTIVKEIEEYGHKVSNIMNIRHRKSKEPLPMFFVDLAPKENNKNIYDMQYLYNTKITIEAPRKKNTIVQCTRCQNYGHTKSYCFRPYACVKCGGEHNTIECKKNPNTPAKCALCGSNHPANYKGCEIYKNLQNARNKNTREQKRPHTSTTENENLNIHDTNHYPLLPQNQNHVNTPTIQRRTFSQTVTQKQQTSDLTESLSTFLNEFKTMVNQLMNQNSMILSMLSTLINKISK